MNFISFCWNHINLLFVSEEKWQIHNVTFCWYNSIFPFIQRIIFHVFFTRLWIIIIVCNSSSMSYFVVWLSVIYLQRCHFSGWWLIHLLFVRWNMLLLFVGWTIFIKWIFLLIIQNIQIIFSDDDYEYNIGDEQNLKKN